MTIALTFTDRTGTPIETRHVPYDDRVAAGEWWFYVRRERDTVEQLTGDVVLGYECATKETP